MRDGCSGLDAEMVSKPSLFVLDPFKSAVGRIIEDVHLTSVPVIILHILVSAEPCTSTAQSPGCYCFIPRTSDEFVSPSVADVFEILAKAGIIDLL